MSALFGITGILGFMGTLIVLIIKAIRKKRLRKTYLFLVGFFVCFIIGILLPSPSKNEQIININKSIEPPVEHSASSKSDSAFTIGENVQGELTDIDSNMTKALITAGYTLEQASEIQKILNTVGIKSIEIESMTGKATDGLNAVVCYPNGLKDRNRRFHFTTDNGVLFYAGFLNEDLYDSQKGGYLKSYGDVHVPETKIDMDTYNRLQMLAIETVKTYLKYPSSSNFDTFAWGIGRSDDKYKIQGKVSAKNAFGVKDDLFFSVYFVQKDNDFSIEGVIINGTRVR
jgi:hypothetical protein